MDGFGIGWAVDQLQQGSRIRRRGWNGKGMWLVLVHGVEWQAESTGSRWSAVIDPPRYRADFVAMRAADGGLVPWLCSQADLLAIDWEAVVE